MTFSGWGLVGNGVKKVPRCFRWKGEGAKGLAGSTFLTQRKYWIIYNQSKQKIAHTAL
jgi:hypothetical protein